MEAKRYTGIAQVLHWGVAGLIVTQYLLAQLAERADADGRVVDQILLLANHKSVGITILALAVARLLWRLTHRPPALPATMPAWQRKASTLAHIALYGFLFALPLSGWLMSSASSYSVSYFGWFTLPDLVAPGADLKERLMLVHEILAKALFAVALLHILAALKHRFIDKDTVMKRMTSAPGLLIFAATALGATFALSQNATQNTPEKPEAAEQTPVPASTAEAVEAVDPEMAAPSAADTSQDPWVIDAGRSEIRFTATQAGAEFSGTFATWTAELWVDPRSIDDTRMDVTIDLTSVQTGDSDRDTTLQDGAWFDTATFAEARFATQSVSRAEKGFVAASTLTLKGQTTPIQFSYQLNREGSRNILVGNATLDRLAMGVGTGDWTDTDTVGQFVEVAVRVVSQPEE